MLPFTPARGAHAAACEAAAKSRVNSSDAEKVAVAGRATNHSLTFGRPRYLTASAPAFATWPSWEESPPETPIAPMILPSTVIGTPPSAKMTPP